MKTPLVASIVRGLLIVMAGLSWSVVHAAEGDERWDHRFGRPALDEGALAAAWFRGELFVGGYFTTAGAAYTPGIARWNGTHFRPVGEGLTPTNLAVVAVTALAVFDGALYAGGQFARSGTIPLPGLARWNGTNWAALPEVAAADVRQLLVHDQALFVVGALQFAGDTNRYGVARWTGASWTTFDSRIAPSAVVGCLAVRGNEVFISGGFENISGAPIAYNARWDGAAWQVLPGLTNQGFWSLAVHEGSLYGSGSFTGIGGVAATNLARWDGTNWAPVGGGFDQPPEQLLPAGDGLFAAGYFKRIGDKAVDGVARWDGQQWEPIGLETWNGSDGPAALCLSEGSRLFAVGVFTSVAGQRAGHVAEWVGTQWRPLTVTPALALADGFALVMALQAFDGGLFAGGSAAQPGGPTRDGVFQLRTNSWQTCGWFGSGRVFALATQTTNLFAGGRFTQVDAVMASNIARWNGAEWQSLGPGTDGEVFALATDGARLYAGGSFAIAGGVLASRIACWDGTNWSALGGGFGNGSVSALAWADGRLYAGGSFTNADGQPTRRIACWDGSQWQPLGEGVEGASASVNAIAVAGTNVYAGGRFTLAGGNPANNIARWDGAAWHALGNGESNGVLSSATAVYALAVRDEVVYVGGRFTNAGSQAIWSLARFDGTNWTSLGAGIRPWTSTTAGYVRALAWDKDALWVGGLFPGAGNKAAASLARWVESPRVHLESPRKVAGGGLSIGLRGVLGLRYAVESSPDLSNWTLFARGGGDAGEVELPDNANAEARFYRAVLEP